MSLPFDINQLASILSIETDEMRTSNNQTESQSFNFTATQSIRYTMGSEKHHQHILLQIVDADHILNHICHEVLVINNILQPFPNHLFSEIVCLHFRALGSFPHHLVDKRP